MKKEVLIAIIAGFALGLVITFGVRTAQKSLARTNTTPEPTPAALAPAPTTSHLISISQPLPNSLMQEDVVTVTGTTTPGSLIAIITGEYQTTTVADSLGHFATDIELSPGANTLTITSFSESGQKAETSIDVAYSTASLEDEAINPSPSPSPSPKAK